LHGYPESDLVNHIKGDVLRHEDANTTAGIIHHVNRDWRKTAIESKQNGACFAAGTAPKI